MTAYDGPILDNHTHLDADHRGIDAVREFARVGGTHLLIVNQPSYKLGVDIRSAEDFRPVFQETVDLTNRAGDILPGDAWPVLGVHPGLISRLLSEGIALSRARELMQAGLELAAEYAADGPAVALKSGRPHYEVTDAVWSASNEIIKKAMDLTAETGVALQLHTESTENLQEIADWAADTGLPGERVVKHYAGGPCSGVTPSVIARKDAISAAIESGSSFMLETDYLDDPERPGAVLGPKTVPRRTKWLNETGHADVIQSIHVDTPRRVYGIDTEHTLETA